MLVIPGASALFPWGELKTSPVHVVAVPVPSALSLPGLWEPRGQGMAEKIKTKVCALYTRPCLHRGAGEEVAVLAPWLRLLRPLSPSPPQQATDMHTHTHTWEGGPQGAREGGESVCLPKTIPALSQEKCITAQQQQGAQRCQVPPALCPSAAPRHSTECPGCPASSCLPLKTKFLLSVNQSSPCGTADLRSCDWRDVAQVGAVSCQRWGRVSATQTPHSDMPPHSTLFCPCSRACPTAAAPLWTEWGVHLARVEFRRVSRATQPLPSPSCSQHLLQPGRAGGLGLGLVPLFPMASGARNGTRGSVLPPELGDSQGGLCFPCPPRQTLTNTHRERKP